MPRPKPTNAALPAPVATPATQAFTAPTLAISTIADEINKGGLPVTHHQVRHAAEALIQEGAIKCLRPTRNLRLFSRSDIPTIRERCRTTSRIAGTIGPRRGGPNQAA